MAIAGPLSSLFLAAIFYLLYVQGMSGGWPLPVNGVIRYLAYINVLLAVFNLLPAFPLDGGRVLRSILWGAWNDLRRATRVSAAVGSAFGIGLIALGILQLIGGNFIAGLWWFLIGMFIRNAAQMSYQQLLVRNALEGEPVRRIREEARRETRLLLVLRQGGGAGLAEIPRRQRIGRRHGHHLSRLLRYRCGHR